jgi:hypothetical protein
VAHVHHSSLKFFALRIPDMWWYLGLGRKMRIGIPKKMGASLCMASESTTWGKLLQLTQNYRY